MAVFCRWGKSHSVNIVASPILALIDKGYVITLVPHIKGTTLFTGVKLSKTYKE